MNQIPYVFISVLCLGLYWHDSVIISMVFLGAVTVISTHYYDKEEDTNTLHYSRQGVEDKQHKIDSRYHRLVEYVVHLAAKVLRDFLQHKMLHQNDLKTYLNNNKHLIFHKYFNGKCCKCITVPSKYKVMSKKQFDFLFFYGDLHFKCEAVKHTSNRCICRLEATHNIRVTFLDLSLLNLLIKNCDGYHKYEQWLQAIMKVRNTTFHLCDLKELSIAKFDGYWQLLSGSVLGLAGEMGHDYLSNIQNEELELSKKVFVIEDLVAEEILIRDYFKNKLSEVENKRKEQFVKRTADKQLPKAKGLVQKIENLSSQINNIVINVSGDVNVTNMLESEDESLETKITESEKSLQGMHSMYIPFLMCMEVPDDWDATKINETFGMLRLCATPNANFRIKSFENLDILVEVLRDVMKQTHLLKTEISSFVSDVLKLSDIGIEKNNTVGITMKGLNDDNMHCKNDAPVDKELDSMDSHPIEENQGSQINNNNLSEDVDDINMLESEDESLETTEWAPPDVNWKAELMTGGSTFALKTEILKDEVDPEIRDLIILFDGKIASLKMSNSPALKITISIHKKNGESLSSTVLGGITSGYIYGRISSIDNVQIGIFIGSDIKEMSILYVFNTKTYDVVSKSSFKVPHYPVNIPVVKRSIVYIPVTEHVIRFKRCLFSKTGKKSSDDINLPFDSTMFSVCLANIGKKSSEVSIQSDTSIILADVYTHSLVGISYDGHKTFDTTFPGNITSCTSLSDNIVLCLVNDNSIYVINTQQVSVCKVPEKIETNVTDIKVIRYHESTGVLCILHGKDQCSVYNLRKDGS